MNRSMSQVASEPEPGDVVVMTTGRVRYEVDAFHLKIGSKPGTYVEATREETFREEPYTRREKVQIGLSAWEDLVRLGASTVHSKPVAAVEA